MTKEVFIALIQKDIRELEMITQGLYETETLSPTIIKLASSKAQEIVTNLQKLAELKTSSSENASTIFPKIKLKSNKEEITPLPDIEESVVEIKEVPEAEPIKTIPVEQITEKIEKPIEAIEQKPLEKVIPKIGVQTETKVEGLSKSKDDSFASTLANKKITDIKQAISIADRFRFQRELFANNAEKMNESLTQLNSCGSLSEAQQYISANFEWKTENETAEDFMNLVKRLFD